MDWEMEKRNLLLKENKILYKISNHSLYNGKIGKQGMIVPPLGELIERETLSQYDYDVQGTDFAVTHKDHIATQVSVRADHEHKVNTLNLQVNLWRKQNRENFEHAYGKNTKALVCYKTKTPGIDNETNDFINKKDGLNEID